MMALDIIRAIIYRWLGAKGTLIGCGTCSARKSNELNLKSDYIIDSNVIYEALNITICRLHRNEDIFLIELHK